MDALYASSEQVVAPEAPAGPVQAVQDAKENPVPRDIF